MRQHEAEAWYWCHGVNLDWKVEANQSWFIDRKDRSQHAPALGRAQHPDYENPDYHLKAVEQWRYLFARDSKDFATEGEHKSY